MTQPPNLVRPFVTHRGPPTEKLAKAYFTPLVAPTPVGTRAPQPSRTADTINGFLRIEAGGGTLRGELLLWDVAVVLSAYAPNAQESVAEDLIEEAVAWGANAQGYTQQMPNGDEWYITFSRCTSKAVRKGDPYVNMTRYRAMVTWRIPGIPIVAGQQFRVINHVVPPTSSAADIVADAPRPTRRR
jgi:hypothetical protein